ncbi:MAG: phosphomannomutase/phosphoglucomutase, partial [Desulfatiglandales bacterium]
MNPNIFREYDIRGTYPEELNKETAYTIGRAIGTYYRRQTAQTVTLGKDARVSSPELHEGLMSGLLDSGVSVVDLGVVPTPLVYFSL